MGRVIRFPRRRSHARTSINSRAAKRANRSDVALAALARSVDRTNSHHSEGILSRLNHLITAQFLAPTSAAIASREAQSSMTERNDVKSKSDMHELVGQMVPIIKANLSHDKEVPPEHSVDMTQDTETIAESEWREGFRQRLRQAQGGRTQETMSRLLGISRDAYAKYVGGRKSAMPVRLLPRFCEICDVSLEWLIEGDQAEKFAKSRKPASKPRKAASR